jgi:hypothetical protein
VHAFEVLLKSARERSGLKKFSERILNENKAGMDF